MSLTIAQNGMKSFQSQVNQIADNLANLQTPGFQAHLTEQQALGNQSGSTTIQTSLQTTKGPLKSTGRALDLSQRGQQLFQLETRNGTGYIRSGRFSSDSEANIVHASSGHRLLGQQGPIQIDDPQIIQNLSVREDGTVIGETGNGNKSFGEIQPVRFPNPGGLRREHDGILRETANSGEPIPLDTERRASVRSGQLEMSNVSVIDQSLGLQRNQRFFQLNARAFRVQNQMLQRLTTNL